jgi:hypothetical protein
MKSTFILDWLDLVSSAAFGLIWFGLVWFVFSFFPVLD